MVSEVSILAPNADDHVDELIIRSLDPSNPKSFFLFAGAGSGKTYSLVKALKEFQKFYGNQFLKHRKKIGVITYTNAACDEILDRIERDPLFDILTIHSFCWQQIKGLNHDIQEWFKSKIPKDIEELELKEAKGRAGKASDVRKKQIIQKREKLEWLSVPREFNYNPNGQNTGMASLNHSDVIKITSSFIENFPNMQKLLIGKYPFILVDESQDTNSNLISSLLFLAKNNEGIFALGLIGDQMQRIYADGLPNIESSLSDNWAKPAKALNRRCPTRIVALANDIRKSADGFTQAALKGKEEGFVRLFILPSALTYEQKAENEDKIRSVMADITSDPEWLTTGKVKTLTLEHRMASIRMGFDQLFEPLYKYNSTGLLDGSLPEIKLFSGQILPAIDFMREGNTYSTLAHLRAKNSPLVAKNFLAKIEENDPLKSARDAVNKLVSLTESEEVTFRQVLEEVAQTNLFAIPKRLIPYIPTKFAKELAEFLENIDFPQEISEEINQPEDKEDLLEEFLGSKFSQVSRYNEYMSDEGEFDTHQGVKGREFPRVLVVIDDSEARGFLFSYEKLFGVKDLSKSDRERIDAGEETGIDRTRRLFYVTCTRAEKSLAIVSYSEDPKRLKEQVLRSGLFLNNEIIEL